MKTRTKYILYFSAAILGITAALTVNSAFSFLKVQGCSMEPAVEKGDLLLVSRWSYLFREPRKGDIAAFPCHVYSEDGEGSVLVKRVVATEGDLVEIKNGVFYINGVMENRYAEKLIYMDSMEPVKVRKNCVFVLSDDRSSVLDSRDQAVGQLRISDITGKVCFK